MVTYLKILVNRKKTNNENDKGKKRTATIRIKFQVAHNIFQGRSMWKTKRQIYKENVIKIKFMKRLWTFTNENTTTWHIPAKHIFD